jgi:hypothetical protein
MSLLIDRFSKLTSTSAPGATTGGGIVFATVMGHDRPPLGAQTRRTKNLFGDRLRWATEGLAVAWPSGSPLRDRPDLTVISGVTSTGSKGTRLIVRCPTDTDEPKVNSISSVKKINGLIFPKWFYL